MEIEIVRRAKKATYTIGQLNIYGHRVCDTLEPHCIDWSKEKKVKGKTAIPEGRYKVVMRLSRKFGKVMPYLEDVPHFESIMIHQGNTPSNTQGCIIVGYNTIRGLVLKSRQAMERIEECIADAQEVGADVWCVVR